MQEGILIWAWLVNSLQHAGSFGCALFNLPLLSLPPASLPRLLKRYSPPPPSLAPIPLLQRHRAQLCRGHLSSC